MAVGAGVASDPPITGSGQGHSPHLVISELHERSSTHVEDGGPGRVARRVSPSLLDRLRGLVDPVPDVHVAAFALRLTGAFFSLVLDAQEDPGPVIAPADPSSLAQHVP